MHLISFHLISISRPIKINTTRLGFSYYNHIFSHYYNDLINSLYIFFVDFIVLIQKIYHLSDFTFLVSINCFRLSFVVLTILEVSWPVCFELKCFNHFFSFTSSSPFSDGMSDFCLLSLALWAIVSSGCNLLFSSSYASSLIFKK